MALAATKTSIRRGDRVRVITGRERGKDGEVLRILFNRKKSIIVTKVIVSGLNKVKKCAKRTQNMPQGGLVERESAIHISDVMLVCEHCGKPTRLGTKTLSDGKRLRMCKRCQEVIEQKAS